MSDSIPVWTKTPGETLDYVWNWATYLGTDTISSSTWTVPAGLGTGAASSTTTTATQTISGGAIGSDNLVKNAIVTAGGRTAERFFLLQVRATK